MRFEFHNRAMRMTPDTDREHRVIEDEFMRLSAQNAQRPQSFQYITTYSAELVKRVMERLQQLPPMWVEAAPDGWVRDPARRECRCGARLYAQLACVCR